MKAKVASSIIHPDGWHLFKIVKEEVVEGTYGTQIKWGLLSSAKDDGGDPIPMTYYTKTVLSKNEKCKLTNLFLACGVIASVDDLDDEEEWDTEILLGKTFEGRVDEKTGDKGTFANIGAVRPKKVKASAKKAAKVQGEADFEDPFAEDE